MYSLFTLLRIIFQIIVAESNFQVNLVLESNYFTKNIQLQYTKTFGSNYKQSS